MPLHADLTSGLVEARIQELIADAERARLVRAARPPRRPLRVQVLRMVARGLRVEREIDISRAPTSGR